MQEEHHAFLESTVSSDETSHNSDSRTDNSVSCGNDFLRSYHKSL